MIQLQHASRWYGQVIGLNDVSCAIAPGVTALLGPNGAGKSTMMKMITGQIRPTAGSLTVFGEKPFANTRMFKRLGYCPEIESGYDELTGKQFVTLMATLSGIDKTALAKKVDQAMERVGIAYAAGSRIGGYSKGMRQRAKIAQAIVHDPDLIVLDEPLSGLDPVGRREIGALFRELGEQGRCVIVSSHILYEVEHMTRNILVLSKGRLLAQGDIYRIRALIDSHPHRILIKSEQSRELALKLLEMPFVLSARFDNPHATEVEVETRAPELFYDRLPGVVLENGFAISSFDSPDNNLEAVFKYLVKG